MISGAISFHTAFKLQIIGYFPSFLHCTPPTPPPLLCNCWDIVMVLIRKIIQILLRASLNCSVLLLPQRLSGEQAACRSLNSHQPVLWTPTLDDHPPWDQYSCWTPGSTAQALLQWHPESSRLLLLLDWMDRSILSLASPQHFNQGLLERPEPRVLEISLLVLSLT